VSEDLIDWLRRMIDEDERKAKAATPGPWSWVDPGGKVKQALVGPGYPYQFVVPSAMGDVYPSVADAEHIARHDPARVLREVEAKRALLEETIRPYLNNGLTTGNIAWLALRLLAMPYADRPGYRREEWRP
jgi:hypothetical protein